MAEIRAPDDADLDLGGPHLSTNMINESEVCVCVSCIGYLKGLYLSCQPILSASNRVIGVIGNILKAPL